ncbi:unnamed protein product [Notodromas monacha]|uniref:UBX domain-containing protein n=1 Tax=Notodromas monacha TaxID=399045 RepID=A0A7R9BV60_9CRUS|nr:unnamed protein product [Notodromas monacha]CAG0921365.1 unnamed protein product [Notodromas monacha]
MIDGGLDDRDIDMMVEETDDSGLSVEQTEKLIQFQEITGVSDLGRCRSLLEQKNWQLEDAVQEQLGFGDVYQQPQENELRVRNIGRQQVEEINRRVAPNRPRDDRGIWPVRIFWRTFRSIVTTMLELLEQIFNSVFLRVQYRRPDPREDVQAFIADFRAKYVTNGLCPPFVDLAYRQALEQAKRELKFLIVYLHSAEHVDVPKFCMESLCNKDVVDFLTTNSLLVYGCSVTSTDGYNVSEIMRETDYPFVALVCLKNNQMTIVERLEGTAPPEKFLAFLRTGIASNEIHLTAARLAREELNASRELRAQQDRAYQESLERDRQLQMERQAVLDAEKREVDRKALILRQKVDFVSRLEPEPDAKQPGVFTINATLPNGQRLMRRFLPQHKLTALFYFVFCHPDSPSEFELVTSYPKRTIPCRPAEVPVDFNPLDTDDGIDPSVDAGLTFEDLQLTSSQVVRVIDLEA